MTWELTTLPINPSYKSLFAFNFGSGAIGTQKFSAGESVNVFRQDDSDSGSVRIEAVGKLQKSGLIGGMAPLYRAMNFIVGDKIKLLCRRDDTGNQYAEIIDIIRSGEVLSKPKINSVTDLTKDFETVLSVFKARYIHIDGYTPELWEHWSPQAEVDVYLTFGDMQEYTEFKYCCGINRNLLSKMGILDQYKKIGEKNAESIPDAILIRRADNQYCIAEFKIRSSDFTKNHSAAKVDVLICWDDDESERSILPRSVVALKSIAQNISRKKLDGDV